MGKREITMNLLSRLLVILISIVLLSGKSQSLSDKRLCADDNCKEIISIGTGKINYRAGEEGMVSFKINSHIRVKSKSAGKDPSLWGVEVNGREGYAPKIFIRETKIYIVDKNLKFEVDVVKPSMEKPNLSISEQSLSKEVSVETTTTRPLDTTPTEMVEKYMSTVQTEIIKTESTPELMEMVDGTKIPITVYDSDGIRKSVKNVEVVNINRKDEHISDDEDGKIGDYGDENDHLYSQDLMLDRSKNTKSEENKKVGNEISDHSELKNMRTAFTGKSLQESYSSANVQNQTYSESSKENEINSENTYAQEQLLSIDSNTRETTISLNSSRTEDVKVKTENQISNYNNDEKSQNHLEQMENHNINNEHKNEMEATEEITDVKEDTNILPTGVDKNTPDENIPQFELNSSVNLVKNQKPSESSKENEINSEKTNAQEQVLSVEINTRETTIILNSSRTKDVEAKTENQILKYNNDEKSQNHLEQMETYNINNEHKNEMEPTEKITDVKKDTNILPTGVDKNSRDENIPQFENKVQNENKDKPQRDLKQNNHSLKESLDNNLNESLKEILENRLKLSNDTPLDNVSHLDNAIVNSTYENSAHFRITAGNEKEKEAESNSTTTNESLKEILENSPKLSNNTSLENVSHLDNGIDNSIKQNNESTVDDININLDVNSEKSESNLENVASIQKVEELEEIYTSTISPQIVDEDSISEMNITPLELQIFNQNEENVPQTKEESSMTTSTNTLTEAPIKIHQTTQYSSHEEEHISSLTTEVSGNGPSEHQSTYFDNAVYDNTYVTENPVQNSNAVDDSVTVSYNSIESQNSDINTDFTRNFEETQAKQSTPRENVDIKENKGLFATIMGTVNNVLSIDKKLKQNEYQDKDQLDKILYSKIGVENKRRSKTIDDTQYCKQIGPNGDCPHQDNELKTPEAHCDCSIMDSVINSDSTFDVFAKALAAKMLEISEVLAFLVIVAAASLFFIFGYYCFCNTSREGALLSKLNQLESSLLALQKENTILKHNLMSTRQKLASIEDNSFGSNDMVVSLKKDLEEELLEKARLQDQITALQKELENAADAGIELNKIVSELLSNQTGDESIISSVEELQKQLNEQQNTILEINASLAEKSRENSELQLIIAEQNARYESELANLQRDNDELEHEKGNLISRLEEIKNDFDRDITTALEAKNVEIKRLQHEILELDSKIESEHTKWQTSVAKIEALEECLKNVRKDPSVNITEIIDVVNVKAQLLEAQRKYKTFKERLESEVDARKLAENQLQIVSAEVEKLKHDYNQSEKDKLEAQTRLEVLSNYFKEKENQLQKELSLKETLWLKQQGETTTTVDRLTAMQEEIQSLKSQNDSLRAEIEAQVAAHKAQTGTLENRAHETWLAARQSDRRYEEARAEATALRRKLTALAGANINEGNKPITLGEDLTNVPSPIHMESPGSPLLGRMPPPPFLPPPFMGPPPPFIGMPPPPPFVAPGEMRPAPLGRIMSPPPQHSGRFSPQHPDYEDYLDYEGNNTWHRHTYSPPPRTYRSLSPTDSRYDYGTERDLMSTYDTETDFSPPPSPREPRRRGGNNSDKSDLSKNAYNSKGFNNKGLLSSGSEKSYNSPSHHDTKTKKGNTGGKSIV